MPPRKGSPVRQEDVQPHRCSIGRRLEILRGTPFFGGLRQEDLAAVNSAFHEVSYAVGEPSAEGLLLRRPFSRQELAAMAGATVETTSRVVSKREGAGSYAAGASGSPLPTKKDWRHWPKRRRSLI